MHSTFYEVVVEWSKVTKPLEIILIKIYAKVSVICMCVRVPVLQCLCVCVCFCEACLCAKVLIEENLSPHKCSLRYANWNITATVARGVGEEK